MYITTALKNTRTQIASLLLASAFILLSFKSPPPCDGEALLNKYAVGLDDYVFIKSFSVSAEKIDDKTEYSYVLSRAISYRIVIGDANTESKKMIVNLYDRNKKLIASNYLKSSKKTFPIINYTCAATGVYYVEAFFEGEKKGCGINILGFKK
ncbi:hypothetical protein CNR22_23090 [Sphingobacteriaceae bacterium]|nr:hypothetical protein CNR22_23090 [Sphingobacteriaceae bacterium]